MRLLNHRFTEKLAFAVLVSVCLGMGSGFAQTVMYNSTNIFIANGANLYIQGDFVNQPGGTITNNGTIIIDGDWENNASNTVFTSAAGTVVFNGQSQEIRGSSPTHFHNLTLANTATKTLFVNTQVSGVMDLGGAELYVRNHEAVVTNTATTAIQHSTGFVSMDSIGKLVRATNSTNAYLFPVGSSAGVSRYRPVHINPNAVSPNSYGVGFLNYNASQDSAFTFNSQAPACYVNIDWFHKITRPSGSSPADISIFFDNSADSTFDGMANFIQLQNSWIDMGTVSVTSNPSPTLSNVRKLGHNSFGNSPYALTIKSIQSGMAAFSPTTVCQGDTVLLVSTVVSTNGYDWLLNGNSLPTAVNGNDTLFATLPGNYVLVASNGVCTDTTAIVTVNVNALPNTSIINPPSFCASSAPSNLFAATQGGTWSGTGITNASLGTFSPAVSGTGTFLVSYSLTDNNNCSNTGTANIVVNVLPNASFTTSSPYCLNASAASFTPTTAGGNFSGPGVSANTFIASNAGVGTHNITYVVTNGSGCTDSTSAQVLVNSIPTIGFPSNPGFCVNGNAANLSATPAGGTWSGTGVSSGGNFDPANVSGAGSFPVVYAFTDNNSCSNQDTLQVIVNALPNAGFTDPGTLCSNGSVVTLVPNTPGGTFSGSGVNANGAFDPALSGGGSFPINYAVTDNNGCSNTATQSVQVNAAPVANIQPSSAPLCENGNSVALTATPTNGTWSGTGIVGNGFFDPNITGIGTFQVIYSITLNGCTDSDTAQLSVSPKPSAAFTMPPGVCVGDAPFSPTPVFPGGTFSGAGIVVATQQFNPAIGQGTYTITYNVTDNSTGCSNSASQPITVDAPATASFTTTALNNNDYSFDASSSVNANSYSWDFGDGTTGSGVQVNHTYAFGGDYIVILTVTNACGSAVSTFNIKVLSFNNHSAQGAIQVFPNPFQNETNIKIDLLSSDIIHIEVYDMAGRLTGNTNNIALPSGTSVIHLKDEFFAAASGTYFVHVKNSKGEVSVHKVACVK
jgi:hypothetical protein